MQSIWHFRVTEYWKQMKSVIQKNSIRNVMDMNSNLGGFAAALSDKDVWVMNVAPVNAFARLKIIYDRGLIGTVHDWYVFKFPSYMELCLYLIFCTGSITFFFSMLLQLFLFLRFYCQFHKFVFCRCEAFSTYPRTYDLLHAWTLFSDIDERGCGIEDLLIEMDRILRPDGFVIIRDKPSTINYIRKFLTALRWDGWVSEVEPRVDALSSTEERVLIARKKLWDDGIMKM